MSKSPSLGLLETFGDEGMAGIFGHDARIQTYLDVEAALAHAQASLGIIPAGAADAIDAAVRELAVDTQRLAVDTRVVGYPILPLLEQLRESGSPEVAAFVHWGATTQDIMDTATALQVSRGLQRVEELLLELGDDLADRADVERATIVAARTHAQPAVPTTLGAKLSVWLAECTRHAQRIERARTTGCVVSLFGAGGTGAALGPNVAATRHQLAQRLGLAGAQVPWHVARDGLFEVGTVLVGVTATTGKIGREVIELARPEIGELGEATGRHRGASSTMPQKANPISSELLVACQVLAASQLPALTTATQGMHERAAGEWQVEWDVLPLLFGYAATALAIAGELVAGLRIDRRRMEMNLRAGGDAIMAEAAMMALAPIVGRGRAHDLVYDACRRMSADRPDLASALTDMLDADVLARLPPLAEILDPRRYLGEADAVADAAIAAWRIGRAARS